MKKIFAIAAAFLLSINLSACNEIGLKEQPKEEITADYPVEIGSMVFEEAPATVVSLSPAITEIICELGYENILAGRSSYCDFPENISSKPDLGSSANPNISEIIKQRPQLLISQSPIAKKDITKIESAGTRVLIMSTPKNYEELSECYTDIARLLGGDINAEASAQAALSPLKSMLDDIKANQNADKSFAYIMTYDLATATGDTLAGNVLSYFGTNIAGENSGYSVTTEELLEKQPDFLILAAPINSQLLPPELQGLTAVKNNRIIVIDNTAFERPTSRLKDTVEYMRQKISELPEAPPEQAPPEQTEPQQ